MWTYRDRRNRAAFSNAQLAYDRAVDPHQQAEPYRAALVLALEQLQRADAAHRLEEVALLARGVDDLLLGGVAQRPVPDPAAVHAQTGLGRVVVVVQTERLARIGRRAVASTIGSSESDAAGRQGQQRFATHLEAGQAAGNGDAAGVPETVAPGSAVPLSVVPLLGLSTGAAGACESTVTLAPGLLLPAASWATTLTTVPLAIGVDGV